jgi:hypothetical protein
VIKIKKKAALKRVTSARMARTYSGDSQTDSQKTTSSEEPHPLSQALPAEEEIILDDRSVSSIVVTESPDSVKADLPAASALKISFKPTANGGIKRVATSQDPDDATASYDVTPRISPTSDAVPTGPGIKGDVEVQGAPARAPRKKRKWLKRGEGESMLPEVPEVQG